MIKLISGTTRIGRTTMTPADGWFYAPSEVEERLVALGVAVFGTDSPGEAVATPAESGDATGAGENPPEYESGAEGAETARLDPGQLQALTNAKLRELAEDMGIDAGKLKTKTQLIEAIAAVDVVPGEPDSEAPPELAPEAPVL